MELTDVSMQTEKLYFPELAQTDRSDYPVLRSTRTTITLFIIFFFIVEQYQEETNTLKSP